MRDSEAKPEDGGFQKSGKLGAAKPERNEINGFQAKDKKGEFL